MDSGDKAPADLCFVQITDMHIEDKASAEVLRGVVPEVNRLAPDFVALTGDLAEEGTPEAYAALKAALSDLQPPALLVIGNHDLLGGKPEFERNVGPLNALHEFGRYAVIVLDSTEETEITWGGGFTEETVEWLRACLQGLPVERPLVLITHHGIYSDQPWAPRENLWWDVLNWEPVHEAFKGRRLVLACAGHAHSNAWFRRGETVHLATTCLSTTRNTHDGLPPGYRLVWLRDGEVQTRRVAVARVAG